MLLTAIVRNAQGGASMIVQGVRARLVRSITQAKNPRATPRKGVSVNERFYSATIAVETAAAAVSQASSRLGTALKRGVSPEAASTSA